MVLVPVKALLPRMYNLRMMFGASVGELLLKYPKALRLQVRWGRVEELAFGPIHSGRDLSVGIW